MTISMRSVRILQNRDYYMREANMAFGCAYNDGQEWHSLSLNLPDVQVSDIAVTEKDLVIGTHGLSIYVLK